MGQVSDGSTADYYQLPPGCTELQDLISYRNLNSQDGEIFRAIYRKGRASHSDELRDARKVLFYAQAEVKRLEALQGVPADFGQQHAIEPAAAIDDESPRMQAIGQNGNSGEHYDAEKLERWKGAPEWATHIVSREGMQEFARLSHWRYYAGSKPDTGCMSFVMADADPSGWTVLEARP